MGTKKAKPTREEYEEWANNTLGVSVGPRAQTHYETASQLIEQQTLQSSFWLSVLADLPNANAAYVQASNGYPLFASSQERPLLLRKSWESFLLKSYRKNISANPRFPRPPVGDWVIPPNWYSQIGDIVRTTLVVKYLDGMTFIASRLLGLARSANLRASATPIARPEGYYAVHVDVVGRVDLPSATWDSMLMAVPLEIQVTTQLQDNIKQLIHGNYERVRVGRARQSDEWQWEYESRDFRANYLGHVLHYLEGMVMGVREPIDD